MAAVDPFWLRDRVGPELDNDPDELIRAAGMAEKLDGRRSPARTVDDPGESGAIKSIRAYQRPRGLKPDGLMNPNGPTVQRMTAELYERGGPRRRIPARGGTVPLWGPVGAGGDNDPRDLAATRHALFLAGLPVRGTDAETPLRRFQQMHGLTVDGRMEPFGPTHDMLDRITAPKLEALAGDDPGRPLAFRPREPEMVGRVLRDRPTTIRTFFQEPDTLPSEAQQAASVSLAAMNVEDAAIQAQWGALAGSEGDDLLAGGAGEDGLEKTPGRDSFSGVEPPPNPVAMVRQRLEQSGVPLTPRQLDQAAREAVSDGVDLGSGADLRILAETVSRTFHDHYQDLEKGLESGRMDIADVEDRLAVLTRDRVTALGNEERRRRIAATTEFLADQYIARARAEGIEIDAEAARARVARIVEAATEEDGIDLETLGDVLWATLDFIPVAGELKSGYEAVDLYSQILDKLEKDPNADVTGLYTDLSLAIFGAVPFLGKVVKGVKLGEKARSAIVGVKAIPSRIQSVIQEQRMRQRLRKMEMRYDKKLPSRPVEEFLSPELLAIMSPTMLATVRSIYVKRKGEAGEIMLRSMLDGAGATRPLAGTRFHRRYEIETIDGSTVPWLFDEVIDERIDQLFGMFSIKRKGGEGTSFEFKLDDGGLTKGQREAESARTELGNEFVPDPSVNLQKSGLELPLIGTNVRKLRAPMEEVPFDVMWATLEKGFRQYNAEQIRKRRIPDQIINDLKHNLRNTYAVYEEALATASAAQRAELRRQFTIGTVFVAAATTILLLEEKKSDASGAGE